MAHRCLDNLGPSVYLLIPSNATISTSTSSIHQYPWHGHNNYTKPIIATAPMVCSLCSLFYLLLDAWSVLNAFILSITQSAGYLCVAYTCVHYHMYVLLNILLAALCAHAHFCTHSWICSLFVYNALCSLIYTYVVQYAQYFLCVVLCAHYCRHT